MKRKIFTLAAALFSTFGAFAQLSPGSVAPDFTLKDLNGNTHHLYDLLAAGKTVFLDMSAAWCGPCWNYHQAGELENLWKQHGPTGGNGVNASTTNDVMVFMIETEPSNTRAQLYGPAMLSGTRANVTQGDWVTGTLYPIIDTNSATTTALATAWKIAYYPTIYMVCRDRLVQEVGQLTASSLYAKSKATCPTAAPASTGVDAKPVIYTGTSAFVCNAAPTVKFQNYSTTNSITSATIKTYAGATVVNTYAWSGNLAPYGVASVTLPSFAGTAYAPYKFEVVVTGDANAANNMSDSTYRVYAAANAVASPWSENFEASANMPYKMTSNAPELRPFQSSGTYVLKGVNGATTRGLLLPNPETATNAVSEVILGNFNTSAATNVALDFDLSYYNASGSTDKAEIKVSKDCGATWTTVWNKSGAALQTTTNAPAANTPYLPTTGSDWRHESVLLTAQKSSNMLIKVVSTDGGGHYAWMDNFRLSNTVNVPTVIANGFVNLYPNPTKDAATLEFSLSHSSNVQIDVIDALGRTVASVANGNMNQGDQRVNIQTSSLSAGTYVISIRTEDGVITQRLSVVK